ncbi:MAG: peptidase U32 family protein [Candidatus Pacearchaeota archaeon]|jgi:putative protease
MNLNNEIEITSPVGSYESLHAAIKSGAGSVYFGAGKLNMRSRSSINFSARDLQKIAKICKQNNVKTYLAVNAVMYDEDLQEMKKICDIAKKSNIDAIIASDISVIQYCSSISMEVHISTQLNVSNIEAVKLFAKYADVIVLARELTLEQITSICKEIEKQKIKGPSGKLVRIEIFAHGALCVSVSGKCYMSLAMYNQSANRGSCLQNCRRSYKVIDEETGDELRVENKYIMSPKDLCTIGFIDKLIESGIKILKIEGRGRPADYVYTTTKVYHEAVESYFNKTYTQEKINSWISQLESVFNRGFWHGGYYLGNKLGEWSGAYGSKATKEKVFIGIAKHYFPKTKIGEFQIQTGKISLGDEIFITGATTGIIQCKVESLFLNEKPTKSAKKGDIVTIPIGERVRQNDKLYLVTLKTKFQENNALRK